MYPALSTKYSHFQVRYTGYRDRPIHERQNKFLNAARDGSTEIVSRISSLDSVEISENLKLPNANSLSSSPHHSQAFVATGFNIIMNFDTSTHFNPAHRQCDFDREVGKVSLIFLQIPFFGRIVSNFNGERADNPSLFPV